MSNTGLPDSRKDFLIVGGGLAGTSLAWYFHIYRISFDMVSCSLPGEASVVSAGVWNPLAMRRINPGWKMTECLEELKRFSNYISPFFSVPVFHFLPIVHPLFHPEELSFWKKKLAQHPSLSTLAEIVEAGNYFGRNYSPFQVVIKPAGWMDVPLFLKESEKIFTEWGSFKKKFFNHRELQMKQDGFIFDGRIYNSLVFCEGWRMGQNPFFSPYVRLEAAKGELMEVAFEEDLSLHSVILNKKIFLKEQSGRKFLCGSTFRWDVLDDKPTPEAARELSEKLSGLLHIPFSVLDQKAGVRPATHDRRPFIGPHPEIRNMYVFNGLGAKGVFLTPHMCEEFINFIRNGKPLDPEVNILRRHIHE